MFAVYKKELKSYFTSVIACLFIAVTSLITGVFFVFYNLLGGTSTMYPVFNALLILVFTIPLLTMRIIADERRQKTDQLILTSPVSVGKIVVGKYLALVTIFLIYIAIVCFYPVFMSKFGEVSMKSSYGTIFGLLLYGMAFIAIGMFISAITESQVIAAILSIAVLLLGYIMNSVTNSISANGNVVTKVLSCFDLYTPVSNIMSGIIKLSDVVYYLTLIVLFIFFTCQAIQKRRWNVSKNTLGTGVFSITFIVVAIVAAVFVNLVANMICSKTNKAMLDVTPSNLYSISSETEDFLKSLDQDVNIYVLSSKAGYDDLVNKTLERFTAASSKLHVEYKDTNEEPTFYQKYSDTVPSAGSIIVENEKSGKFKLIDYYYDIYDNKYTQDGRVESSSYDGEGLLNSAIANVTSEKTMYAYMVSGHNEAVLDSQSFGGYDNLKDAVEKYNLEIKDVNLITGEIDKDECAVLLIMGPEIDYSKEEAEKVNNYLKSGGAAIIALENRNAFGTKMPNLESILLDYDVTLADGIVAENDESWYYAQGGQYYVLSKGYIGYGYGLSSYIFTPFMRGIINRNTKDSAIVFNELAITSYDAVSKTDASDLANTEKTDKDIAGPFTTVATSTHDYLDDNGKKTQGRMLIFSSVYAFSDAIDNVVNKSNTQIVINALKDYVDPNAEGVVKSVSVPAKSMESPSLTVTTSGARMYTIIVVVIIPLVFLIGGLSTWIGRRRR